MASSQDVYKRVKIAGLLLMIPATLAAMPVAGYVAAVFLRKKFAFPEFWCSVMAAVGLAAGIRETIRIIKLVIGIERENGRRH